jgi:hypothetical protein
MTFWLQIIQPRGEARIAPDSPEEAVRLDANGSLLRTDFSWGRESGSVE